MEWWLYRASDRAMSGPFRDGLSAEAARKGDWAEATVVGSPPARRPKRPDHILGCDWYRGAPCGCAPLSMAETDRRSE